MALASHRGGPSADHKPGWAGFSVVGAQFEGPERFLDFPTRLALVEGLGNLDFQLKRTENQSFCAHPTPYLGSSPSHDSTKRATLLLLYFSVYLGSPFPSLRSESPLSSKTQL